MYLCPYCAVDYTLERPCFCHPPPPIKSTSARVPEVEGAWGEAAAAWSLKSDLPAEPLPEPVLVEVCFLHSPSQHATPPSRVQVPWGEAAAGWSFDVPAGSQFPETPRVEDCVHVGDTVKSIPTSKHIVNGPWGEAAPAWSLGPGVKAEPLPEPRTVGDCSRLVSLRLKRTCIAGVRARVPWGDAGEVWSVEQDVATETVRQPP